MLLYCVCVSIEAATTRGKINIYIIYRLITKVGCYSICCNSLWSYIDMYYAPCLIMLIIVIIDDILTIAMDMNGWSLQT